MDLKARSVMQFKKPGGHVRDRMIAKVRRQVRQTHLRVAIPLAVPEAARRRQVLRRGIGFRGGQLFLRRRRVKQECIWGLARMAAAGIFARALGQGLVVAPVAAVKPRREQIAQNARVRRLEAGELLEHGSGLVRAVQLAQDLAAPVQRARKIGLKGQRPLEAVQGLRQAAQRRHRVAAIGQQSRQAGLQQEGFVEQRQSLDAAALFQERHAEIGHSRHEVGLEAEGFFETLDGLAEAAQSDKHIAPVGPSLGQVGPCGENARIAGERTPQIALRMQVLGGPELSFERHYRSFFLGRPER